MSFPYVVELELPPGGLDSGDLKLVAFHKERGIEPQFVSAAGESCVTLCFARATDAEAFQRRFGGTRISRIEGRQGFST